MTTSDRLYRVELTHSQALVLYKHLYDLEEEQKLDPEAPYFDPAVHRALEIVFFALEEQLPRVDDRVEFERAHDELRNEFREYWERRLPKPPS
jgi:hypothetical protein